MPSIANPSAAEKSSSLPSNTSTCSTSLWFTSAAPRRPADRLPQRGPVVEVVGDDRPVPASRLDRLEHDVGGRLRERREDAAAMEPARAVDTEDPLPVDVAGPHL